MFVLEGVLLLGGSLGYFNHMTKLLLSLLSSVFKLVIQLLLLSLSILFSFGFLKLTHLVDFLKMLLGLAFLLFKESCSLLIGLSVYLLDILQSVLFLLVN
jgi:hypothetical protein